MPSNFLLTLQCQGDVSRQNRHWREEEGAHRGLVCPNSNTRSVSTDSSNMCRRCDSMHFLVHLLCSSARTGGRKEILAPACNPCWVVSWTGAASYGKNSGTKTWFNFQTTTQILSEQSEHHPFPHKKMKKCRSK